MGAVNLFADMTYEGGASINGPFLASLWRERRNRRHRRRFRRGSRLWLYLRFDLERIAERCMQANLREIVAHDGVDAR
jgi:hypothetical protein